MINRDKYAEYLDSALIHRFINDLDPKLSNKVFSLKFYNPFLASGKRFFDSSYEKQGMFIVRNRETNEIIRFGFSHNKVRDIMYRYLWRLPKNISSLCDCAILSTYNGEHKELAVLLEKVVNFEIEYHNYFFLKNDIENPDSHVDIEKLERVFPYTGRISKKGKGRKEWTIPAQSWKSGVYIIWKDDIVDYIGKGKKLAVRLYDHFLDRSKYLEKYKNGCEYSHRHVYYPLEEIEQGRIKIATIPVYRKVVKSDLPWGEKDIEPETDISFSKRISDLEARLLRFYKPVMNMKGIEDDKEEFENDFFEEKENPTSISDIFDEDPPF